MLHRDLGGGMYVENQYDLYDGAVVFNHCTAEDGQELKLFANEMSTS